MNTYIYSTKAAIQVVERLSPKDVQNSVSSYVTCQQTKYLPKAPRRLLQPIPPTTSIWEDITMDFIVGLPANNRQTIIFVVVDRFSKASHFGILPTHFTAYKTAKLFTQMVCKLYGYPKSIISNRDPIFICKFWRTLFLLNGRKLCMITAYHPETDG